MRMRTVALLVLFVILTWAGSAGIAYGVVELTGGGPQGEQGEQGEQGDRGKQGLRGTAGEAAADFEVGSGIHPLDLSLSTRRLAEMFAANTLGEASTHPRTIACVDYIMNNEGSFVECGFLRIE